MDGILRLPHYGILGHMFSEQVLLASGVVMELAVEGRQFRMTVKDKSQTLVEYVPGFRTVRGRRSAYEFKSVEKLRYDFEKDAEDAQRQG
jgi:hypothetical protein